MSLIGALKVLKAGEAAKKTAPFYSAVDEALAAIKRPKGTGTEFLTELMKTKGVKPAEIADRKLEQAFKAKGKMTKEEAQQVLKDNPPPKLSEKTLEEMSEDAREERFRELMENQGYERYNEVPRGAKQRYEEQIAAEDVQHGEHRLPGGDNYREILLKLPKKELSSHNYSHKHWADEPNVLAHMRVLDRKGPNGEKVLHVEEIQSDWHQHGRKKGYKPEDYIEQMNALEQQFKDLVNKRGELLNQAERIGYRGEGHRDLVDEANGITPQLMQLQEQKDNLQNVINYGVPEAPFKKNWHELAMKRLLNYAADNGYDSIAITPGMEQAKRWNNEALKVHYDQKIPQFLNEFGKPYGAQVDQMPFDAGGYKVNRDDYPLPYRVELQNSPDIISRHATPEEAWAEAERLGQLPLHSFKITPEMRESIKQKGLPLYQQIGIPTAGAGAASQMPEQMQEPVLEPEVKKADGGAINYNTAPDMTDGERIMQGAPFKRGGKVKLTTNRDTMFLELSNKKLKRK
jgi:hypothetical protein